MDLLTYMISSAQSIRDILVGYLRAEDSQYWTYKRLGKCLGISTERVRQIEARFMYRFHHPKHSILKDYLNLLTKDGGDYERCSC